MKKRAGRKEIAAECGVSPSTVSRALNDHPAISGATRRRVKAAAQRMGYVPSELGRSHYQAKSFRIALVTPSYPDNPRLILPYEYFTRTMYGLAFAADERGYAVSVIVDRGFGTGDLKRLVLSRSADGLVFIGCRIGDQRFGPLHGDGIPFIFIHHYEKDRPYPFVDCDPRPGMQEAVECIRKKGVKRLGFLSAGRKFHNSLDRLDALRTAAVKCGTEIVVRAAGDYSRTSGRKAAAVFLKKGLPDAIFCANDRMAFGLMEGLKAAGVRIPEDTGIIGFDNQEISELSDPMISTIENPFYAIGERAAAKLINMIRGQGESGESLPSRFIQRHSV